MNRRAGWRRWRQGACRLGTRPLPGRGRAGGCFANLCVDRPLPWRAFRDARAARALRGIRLAPRLEGPGAAGLRIACRGGRADRPTRANVPSYGSAGVDRRWGRIPMRASISETGASGDLRARPLSVAPRRGVVPPRPATRRRRPRPRDPPAGGLRLRSRGHPRLLMASASTGRRPDTGSTVEQPCETVRPWSAICSRPRLGPQPLAGRLDPARPPPTHPIPTA